MVSQPAAEIQTADPENAKEAVLTPPPKPKRKSRFEPETDKASLQQVPTPAKQESKQQRKDGKWDMFAEADTFGNQYSVSSGIFCSLCSTLCLFSFTVCNFEECTLQRCQLLRIVGNCYGLM